MLSFFRAAPAPDAARAIEDSLVELAPLVRGWVFRYVGPHPDLDDFIQEAMIELVRSLETFRGDSSLKTYARQVVMRSVARHSRRHRRRARPLVAVEDDQPSSLDDPERATATQRDVRWLYDALSALPENRRNAIVLCDIEGLSHQEAADVEGVKLDALRARLKHGRAQLREMLGLTAQPEDA